MFWIQPVQLKYPDCPRCGATLQRISSSGRVGCAQCYQHFGQILRPYILRVHGPVEHIGRSPEALSGKAAGKRRLAELERALAEAVSAQEFERCASLRDEILALKGDAT